MTRALALALILSAPAVDAHPHLFLDTGLNPVFNAEGALVGVRVIWLYDEFYSLLLIEENTFDRDGDGRLTTDEAAKLAGFDQRPDEGFTGTSAIYQGDTPLPLSEPFQPSITLEAGRLISTHLRLLNEPLAMGGAPVLLRTFDPTYYAAFDLSLTPRTEGGGAGCDLVVTEPDTDTAMRVLEQVLGGPASDFSETDDFPEVGENFADTLMLTCPAPD